MQVLLFIPLVLPALAAAAARPLAARLEPCRATWLLTLAAVILAGCSTAALALLAAWAAAAAPPLAALGDYSAAVARRGDPAPALTGGAAALLLAGIGVATTLTVRRRARALAESYRRGARRQPGRHRGVVVTSPAIDAYALPGWPGRIVVTTGVLAALDTPGRAALLAHEQAHLAGQHHLFTTATRLAAAANPLLIPLVQAVDFTTERWADERAALATGDRRLVAATIGRVALLATAPVRATPARAITAGGAAALGITGRPARRMSLAWAGPVPRRVAALLAPAPPRRTLLLAAAAAIILLAGVSALEAARDLHALLELARAAG
jgi:Zn-dependent protease with chaperone function